MIIIIIIVGRLRGRKSHRVIIEELGFTFSFELASRARPDPIRTVNRIGDPDVCVLIILFTNKITAARGGRGCVYGDNRPKCNNPAPMTYTGCMSFSAHSVVRVGLVNERKQFFFFLQRVSDEERIYLDRRDVFIRVKR